MSPVEKAFGGRPVQPAALALMLAALVEALALLPWLPWHSLSHRESGTHGDWFVHSAGLLAFAIVVLLASAWWRRSRRCLDWGLQASTILWLWLASVSLISGLPPARTALAVAWAVLAAGSAWLEEGDRRA